MKARRPPLWLAAAAVASFWAAVYTLGRWALLFAVGPIHQDTRFTYVASEAGVRYGWSKIYDQAILHALSSGFPGGAQVVHGSDTYVNPPLLAWLFAPLTVFSEPVAYALWTLISLAAMVLAWRLAAPFSGVAKLTLLLLAMGLTPVLLVLYFGQPDLVVMALVAVAWWFCAREKGLGCAVALAAATFIKPQLVPLLPLALLVSRRYRMVATYGAACVVLAAITALSLGQDGLLGWWRDLQGVQSDPAQYADTLVRVFGLGPVTVMLWTLEAAAALLIAFRDRRPEIVFAAGILGSAAAAFHFHYWDYTNLILAAWLVLRTAPPLPHRLWLLAGVVPMQLMAYQASHADVPLVAPQLAWDAIWLVILLAATFAAPHSVASRPPTPLRHTEVEA
jgi:hypothetical protein